MFLSEPSVVNRGELTTKTGQGELKVSEKSQQLLINYFSKSLSLGVKTMFDRLNVHEQRIHIKKELEN